MDEKELKNKENEEKEDKYKGPKEEDWATLALEELDDFIESQGIYIRQ